MRPFRWLPVLALAACLTAPSFHAQNPAALTSPEERANLHRGPEWETIATHLPDPRTAGADRLETAADVLRARRFPEDALDYYEYAVQRGGNVTRLLNKMGVVRLELNQTELARQMFFRVVRVNKKDSQGWNNLGATEYSQRHYQSAISDYRKAIHFNRGSAVYHANLAMAYFENKDADSAQRELTTAVALDPAIMQQRDSGGMTAHIVGSQNYPELCFDLARVYARAGKPELVRLYLAKASEGGFDVRTHIVGDAALKPFLADPEVKLLLANAEEMRKAHLSPALEKTAGLGSELPAHRIESN